MKMLNLTTEEIKSIVVRLKEQRHQGEYFDTNSGIPVEVYQFLFGSTFYSMISSTSSDGFLTTKPPLVSRHGLNVAIAECPPDRGVPLHTHHRSEETFMCISGRFKVQLGEGGRDEVFLDPFDLISVPPCVFRQLTNISNDKGLLLVFVTGTEAADDYLAFAPEVSQQIADRFGLGMLKKLETATGTRFLTHFEAT